MGSTGGGGALGGGNGGIRGGALGKGHSGGVAKGVNGRSQGRLADTKTAVKAYRQIHAGVAQAISTDSRSQTIKHRQLWPSQVPDEHIELERRRLGLARRKHNHQSLLQ